MVNGSLPMVSGQPHRAGRTRQGKAAAPAYQEGKPVQCLSVFKL